MTKALEALIQFIQRSERRRRLCHGEGDWIGAHMGERVSKHTTGQAEAARRLLRTHGGLNARTANTRIEQARALALVPNKDVWLAVGWTQIRGQLLKVSAKDRAKRQKKILATFERDGVRLSRGAVLKLTQGGKQKNAPTKPRARGAKAKCSCHVCTSAIPALAAFAAANPALAELLPKEVLALLDLKKRKQA